MFILKQINEGTVSLNKVKYFMSANAMKMFGPIMCVTQTKWFTLAAYCMQTDEKHLS